MPAAAQTQTPAAPSRTETVTVSTEPVPLETLSGSYTGLDRAAIEASGARDAAELLRSLASAHFSQSGGKGALSTLTIRGGKPNFTLVLIDGIVVNDIGDTLGGAFNFATLDLDQIERIDIYRGPLSAIYGSEAISGVVNIILRKPADQPAFHISSEGGEYGYARSAGGVSRTLEGVAVAASGSYSRIGQQVLEDGSSLGTASLTADRAFGSVKTLHGFARWNRLSDSNLPISSGGPLYAISKEPEISAADQTTAGAQFRQQLRPGWLSSFSGGVFSRVARDASPAIFDSMPPGPGYVPSMLSRTRFLRAEGETTQQFTPRPWLNSYTRLEVGNESGTTRGTLGPYPDSYLLNRTTLRVLEDANLQGRRGSLGAGFAVEKSTAYSAVTSPRAGGTLNLSGYSLHASWGRGFKLPSFYSLGDLLVGNPQLKPETSRGVEVGIAHRVPSTATKLSLSYFDNRYDNLIDFSPSLFKLVNRSEAIARGSDLEVRQRFRSLALGGSVTYVDAGLQGSAERLRDVPRWTEALYARYVYRGTWTAQCNTVWVGRRFDFQVPVPQKTTVPRYSVTNVELSREFGWGRRSVLASIRLENAFNSHFQEFIGFPNAGVYASAGITYRLASR